MLLFYVKLEDKEVAVHVARKYLVAVAVEKDFLDCRALRVYALGVRDGLLLLLSDPLLQRPVLILVELPEAKHAARVPSQVEGQIRMGFYCISIVFMSDIILRPIL